MSKREAWSFFRGALKKIIKYRYSVLFLLLILALLSVRFAIVFPEEGNRLSGSAVSIAAMATAPFRGLGVPYQDYWGYESPGIMLLVGFWTKMFGSTMFSFKVLQFLFLLGTGPLVYLILKKIFSPFYTLVLSFLMIVVLYSPYLNFPFLQAEQFGLFFSLLGLVCLLSLKGIRPRFFLGSFFLALSSQMVDPFALTILAIVPPLIYLAAFKSSKLSLKATKSIFGGISLVGLIVGGYLVAIGSLNAYFRVLIIKLNIWAWSKLAEFPDLYAYTFWHAKNIFLLLQSEILLILLLWLLLALLSVDLRNGWSLSRLKTSKGFYVITLPLIKLKHASQTFDALTVISYSLGSFILFSMYGLFDFQHLYQIALPVYFFWAIMIKSIIDSLQKILPRLKINFLLLPVLLIFLFPKGPYLKNYFLAGYSPGTLARRIYSNITMPDSSSEFEDYINSKTDKDSCILSVYGWSVGKTYFYAHRRPCTRFFLPSDVMMTWQKEEYKRSLFENPPQAIIYSRDQAGIDVDLFEKEVINLTKIKEKCYRLTSKDPPLSSNLYLPRFLGDELKACLKENSG